MDLAWRLHPAAAISDLVQRATDSSLQPKERRAAITAIAFIKDKKAAEAMLALNKNHLQDVAEQASYWLSFRQGNDWYSLLNWKNIKLNTGYERKLANMKAKLLGVLDEQSCSECPQIAVRADDKRFRGRPAINGIWLLRINFQKSSFPPWKS